jgi:hypothetical protein
MYEPENERRQLLLALVGTEVFRYTKGVPSIADRTSKASVKLARLIFEQLPSEAAERAQIPPQTLGTTFEKLVAAMLARSLRSMSACHDGRLEVIQSDAHGIQDFEQYTHLRKISEISESNPEVASLLGQDYLIRPDVIVVKNPLSGAALARVCVEAAAVDTRILSPTVVGVRALHASVSCKLTIRSDRSQNARSEALNLMRLRNGRVPHIAVVTAEPMPSRVRSIALGSGDVDCTYHVALRELRSAVSDVGGEMEQQLNVLVKTKRLRDIADLPLDLI